MSKSRARLLLDPILDTNPITVQLLGVCSALAVTRFVEPAMIMALAATTVMVVANVSISLLRHQMPESVRLILQMTIIASAVIVADEILRAFTPDVAETLTVFVGLIITNCIVLGRAEVFAMHNPPIASALDALGNGAGYASVLVVVAVVRELWGEGSLLGYDIIEVSEHSVSLLRNALMAQPASAFFLVAMLVWLQHTLRRRTAKMRQASE